MAKIILVSGGSASGKTYVINEVIKLLGDKDITRISLDDYYKDLTKLTIEERAKINYDHPKAFDWPLLKSQLKAIKNDEEIKKPVYDFVTHNRSSEIEIIKPKKIIIVEGIMALVNKDVRELGDLKIFINATRERRLIRRIERDQKERGRTLESIITQYFSTVLPMYEEIIAPSSIYADMLINNDGYDNKSIEVIVSVIRSMINGEIK